MKYLTIVAALLLAFAGITSAAPYGSEGRITEYQQPGAGKVTLRVLGDEFQARTETLDGYTVVFNPADQTYYYASVSADGQTLESTGIKVGQPAPGGHGKHQSIAPDARRKISAANRATFDADRAQLWRQRVKAAREKRDRQAGVLPAAGDGSSSPAPAAAAQAAAVNGNKVGLTILVQFPDDPNTGAVDPTNFPTDQAKIQRYTSSVNYTEDGNSGSVRDYFFDQSNGALTYTQSVTPIVTLPNARNYYNYSDYPANTTLRDSGATGRLVIQDAVNSLIASGYDFSTLSVDGSNKVIATNVLFAGNDSGVWSQGLWPHAWSMSGSGINVGTAQSPRYVYRYEITNIANASPVIGTFCHENGHLLLGYPDLYDYDGDSEGVGSHCLMASGNYCNGGRTPAPIDLYLKDVVGWANILDLITDQGVSVSLPTTGNVGRRIRRPGVNTEYFLVENRGAGDKWAASVPDKGICIWHIDEAKDGDSEQQMTSSQHYEVSLEQADGLFDMEMNRDRGDAQDLFDSSVSNFNDGTTPNAHWWSDVASGVKVHIVSAAGANMTVEFGDMVPPNTIALRAPNGGETVYYGTTTTIGWNANITGNVKVDLLKGGVLESTLSADEPNDGLYSWTVSAALPMGTDYTLRVSSVNDPSIFDDSDAVFEIKDQPTLADALDSGDFVWTTGGTANWFAQTTTTHDGSDAAQSGSIGNSKSSFIQTAVNGPCTLSFWWKVSSESNDYLRFYLDGVEQTGSLAKISGNVDWTQKNALIPAGSHTVKWEYAKNVNSTGGSDAAWLDQVQVIQPEIAVEAPAGTGLVDGSSSIYCGASNIGGPAPARTFTIKNTGVADLVGLAVTKDGANAGDFAISALGATTLAAGASTTFTVTFTAGAAGARNAAIHIASNDADENPFDIAVTGNGVNAPANSATWTNTAGGSWLAESNWFGGVVGNGSAVTAHFETLTLPSDTTVTLDEARTIGGLKFGDAGNQHSWTVAAGGGGALTLANSAQPVVEVTNQTANISAAVSGSQGLSKIGTGALTLSGTNTYTGPTNVNAGTLQVGNGGSTGDLNSNTTLTVAANATAQWFRGDTSQVTVANQLLGSGTVAFTGLGTTDIASQYTLSSDNSGFSGLISLNGGRLAVSAANQLGNSSVNILANGQLFPTGSVQIANNITITDSSGWRDSGMRLGAIRMEGSTGLTNLTLNHTTAMVSGDTSGFNALLCGYSAGTHTISGIVSGNGEFSLSRFTSSNGGTAQTVNFDLTGTVSNTFTGKTVVDGQAGVASLRLMKTGGAIALPGGNIVQLGNNTTSQANLRVGDTTSTGSARNQWDNQFGTANGGVTLNFINASGQWIRFDLQGTKQSVAGLNAGTATTQAGAVIQNQNLQAFDPGQDATLTLVGSGTYLYNGYLRDQDNSGTTRKLNLVKSGTGTQTLAGTQLTYTGTTTVNGGTLVLRRDNSDWTLPTGVKTIAAGGTLKVDLTPQTTQYRKTNLGTIGVDGVLELYGTTDNVNGYYLINAFTGSGAGTLRITGGGAIGIWTGAANCLSGFSGLLDIQNGRFACNVDSTSTLGGSLDVNIASTGRLDLRSGHFTIDALDGVAGSQVAKSYTGDTINFTIGNNNGSGTFAGVMSGTNYNIIKAGDGTETFTGANTYTGTTTINAGKLLINGSLGNTTTTVAAGGALGGTGTINGAVTVNGTLAPGITGVGTLAITKPLTLGSNSSLAFDIGTTSDRVNISGALVLDGTLNISSVSGFGPGTYTLMTYTGTLTNNVLNIGATPSSSYQYTIDTATTGQVKLVVSLTPFASWQMANFGSTTDPEAAADADPDGDGVPNLIERALGLNPKVPNANPIVLEQEEIAGQNYLRLRVTRDPAVTDVSIEGLSADLLTDSWSPANTVVEANTATEFRVRDSQPISAKAHRFLKLRFSAQ